MSPDPIADPAPPRGSNGHNVEKSLAGGDSLVSEDGPEDGRVRYESVFRARWRDRQSARARPGELIEQPAWIDAGLVVLAVLFAIGVLAGAKITVARTAALPAVVQGTSVTAVGSTDPHLSPGIAVQYRDASGATRGAVVAQVTPTEVIAQLPQPGPPSAGELLVPAGRQRLISVLLPRLG
jgi:hypothetical protein